MLKTVLLTVVLVVAVAPGARALSLWWTPPDKSCPAFDSEEDCESWCAAHEHLCNGATDCQSETGIQVPECPPPPSE